MLWDLTLSYIWLSTRVQHINWTCKSVPLHSHVHLCLGDFSHLMFHVGASICMVFRLAISFRLSLKPKVQFSFKPCTFYGYSFSIKHICLSFCSDFSCFYVSDGSQEVVGKEQKRILFWRWHSCVLLIISWHLSVLFFKLFPGSIFASFSYYSKLIGVTIKKFHVLLFPFFQSFSFLFMVIIARDPVLPFGYMPGTLCYNGFCAIYCLQIWLRNYKEDICLEVILMHACL